MRQRSYSQGTITCPTSRTLAVPISFISNLTTLQVPRKLAGVDPRPEGKRNPADQRSFLIPLPTVGRLARILRKGHGARHLDLFSRHICRKGRLGGVGRQFDPNTFRRNAVKTGSPPNPPRPCHRTWGWSDQCPQVPQTGHSASSSFEDVGLICSRLQEEFEGEVMHAYEYTTAKKYVGKKAVVVGAATSGHDVSHDLARQGVGE